MRRASRLFHGKVAKVHRPDVIEIQLDLGFGAQLTKRFQLVQLPEIIEDPDTTPFTHAMVVLAGGKRVIAQPEGPQEHWAHLPEVPARVFLAEKIYGEPVGLTRDLPTHRDPVLELSPFLAWLAESDGEYVRTVRGFLNPRNGGKRG